MGQAYSNRVTSAWHRGRTAYSHALTLLLLFTPLAFGTVEIWSIAVAELLVLFIGAIWFVQMIRDGRIQTDRTPFTVLILDQNASAETVHKKWLKKMRAYHPDNHEDPTGWIAKQSWSLNEAYAVLKDPEKRREYDARRKAQMKGRFRAAGGYRSHRSRLPDRYR